jgi:hypothetical protein
MFFCDARSQRNFDVFQIIEPRSDRIVPFIFVPLRNGNFSVTDSDKGIFVLGPNRYVLI